MLNKVKPGGNMYQFLNDYPTAGSNRGFTWNPIKGECPHDCVYCFVKRYYIKAEYGYKQPELHLDERELKTDLGQGNYIFVGSSCDMWADDILEWWIDKVLGHCHSYPNNKYLFQTKNPQGFHGGFVFPNDTILGITLETNRPTNGVSRAPSPVSRVMAFATLNYPKMVSIEPIMKLDVDVMVDWIKEIAPEFVSIGADSKEHYLPEPTGDKIEALIEGLQGFTEVKTKSNLKRLIGR